MGEPRRVGLEGATPFSLIIAILDQPSCVHLDHDDYPHEQGQLYDCAACEGGRCVAQLDCPGCVSRECMYGSFGGFGDRGGAT